MRNTKKENREIARILKEKIEVQGHFCDGCLDSHSGLTASHIIRRSKRIDLITDPRNIKKHCTDCHDNWDSFNIERMKKLIDFDDNLLYIKEVDRLYYNRIIIKIEENEIK